MISVRFIMKKIFEMLRLELKIQVTKARKTLKLYENYWKEIESLLDDETQTIIHK